MASDSPRILVLAGGLSHERDVSLRSGRRAAEALREAGCHVSISDVDARLLETIEADRPDVVWPLLHGVTGEDGSVRDVLELVNVPYIGAGPGASRLGWDKPVGKHIMGRAGARTPRYVALPQSLFRELGADNVLQSILSQFDVPLVVKPARGGSALGVTIVRSPDELPRAMVDCFAYGDVALIETAVIGTEVAVSIVETETGISALPAVEIVSTDGVYDYDARYNPGRVKYFAPARLDPVQSQAAADLALLAHETLGLRHISRTDMIIDDDGQPWFLEVNVAPGLTETSLLPQAALAAGKELGALYRAIVENAVG
ncbi:MAG TPA: D-alanine--D-alanine ligase [Actinomycetales bacterium]|nr:D-alanine--D-alanine ligase [Actinomycetales bacterium]